MPVRDKKPKRQDAVAIANANLIKQERQRADAMDFLQRVSAKISAALDEKETLALIIEGAMRLTGTESGVIHLIDEAKQAVIQSYEVPEDFGHLPPRLSQKTGMTWTAVSTGQTIAVSDITKDERVNPAMAEEKGVRAIIGTPLKVEEETIGVLFLNDSEPHEFTEYEKELLSTLANHAAIAIQNARLFGDAERRIRDLGIVNRVVETISTKLEPYGLLETIVSQIADKLRCTHCTIFLLQEEEGELLLVPQVTHGVREEIMTRRFKLNEGLAGWVFQKGESVVLDNVMDDPRFASAREPREQPRSMLVAPVKVGDQTIGVISADQDEYGWFSESDRRLVDALAQQAGIAIQRAIGLALLQDIGNQIISPQKLDDILQQVVSGAIKLTNTTSGIIYLVSGDGKSVTDRFAYPPGFDHPEPRMDREESITHQVIKTGEVLIFPDAHQDVRQGARVNPALYDRVRSMIAVPLKLEQKVIGVLFLNDADQHDFTETEVSLLSTLVSQAAIAIQNARLFETRLRLNAQLASLHQVVQEQSLDKVLDRILKGISAILGEETSPTINLYDEETDRFGQCHAYGPLKDKLRVPPRSTGGTGRYVLKTGEPLYLDDVHNPPPGCPTVRPESIAMGIKSFAALPLKRQEQVVGVLFVNAQKPLLFSEEIRRVLDLFASQAAIAIENAALFEQERQRADALDLLREVSGKISTTLDEKETLAVIIEGAMRLTGTESGVIHLVDEAREAVIRSYETPEGFGHLPPRFSQKTGMTWEAVSTGRTIAVPDITKDKRANPAMVEKGVRAIIGTPLKVEEETLGVLFLNDSEPHEFTEYEKELLSTLASQAAIAIQNARSYEQRVQDLLALAEINEAILVKDLDKITQLIADRAAQSMGADYCVLRLVDSSGQYLVPKASSGREIRKDPLPVDDGSFTGWVALHRKAELLSDVSQAERQAKPYLKWYEDVKSCMGAPLRYGERLIGTLYVESTQLGAFEESQLALLQSFADQAAIAIENARLYQNLGRRVQELEVLTEIGRTVSNLGVGEILEQIYKQAGKLMDVRNIQIAFYDEDTDTVRFPLAYSEGKKVKVGIGIFAPRKRGEDRYGLTEYVIDHGKAEISKGDVWKWADERGIELSRDLPTKAWIGAPLKVWDQERQKERVVGLISIQSLEKEDAYDENDLQVLETIANQAAVAIENATLFKEKDQALVALREEQRKNLAAGRLAAVNTVAAEFTHKMNNIAGTIPVRVEQIRELLDPSDERHPRISHFLDAISDDVESVLRIAGAIRSSDLAEENLELVDIDTLVSTAIQRIAIPSEVTISNQCTRGLPQVLAFSGQLVDTLENIIRNGLEAIEGAGTVTISCRKAVKDSQEWVAIEVKDTGRGIPAEDLSKIFGLFFTTKPNGMGFALWRTRTLVESLGGSVTVSSEVGKGTAFTILLPVA